MQCISGSKAFGFLAILSKLFLVLVFGLFQHSEGARIVRGWAKPAHAPMSKQEIVFINEQSNSSFEIKYLGECICPLGEYWDEISKSCVKQGGADYECGRFKQKDRRVCKEGFVCKAPLTGSLPSTCRRCTVKDNCRSAENRHKAFCVKAVQVTGKTCSTVQATLLPPAVAPVAPAPASAPAAAPAPALVAAAAPGPGPATAAPSVTIEACLSAREARSLVGFKEEQRALTEKDAFEMIFAARADSFGRATTRATAEAKRMGGAAAGSAAVAVVATTTITTTTQAIGLNPRRGLIIASGHSSFTVVVNTTCPCPLGMFWNTVSNACVKQGGFGYECGFFPQVSQHRVCQDGLTCRTVTHVEDNYVSHGMYENKAGTEPAACRPCTVEDKCKTGLERHEAACPKQASIMGNSCSTVNLKVQPAEHATAPAPAAPLGLAPAPAPAVSLAAAPGLAPAPAPSAAESMVTGEACAAAAQRTVDLAFEQPLTDGMDVKMMQRARARPFMSASSEAREKAAALSR